jgi:hypothetical protein
MSISFVDILWKWVGFCALACRAISRGVWGLGQSSLCRPVLKVFTSEQKKSVFFSLFWDYF